MLGGGASHCTASAGYAADMCAQSHSDLVRELHELKVEVQSRYPRAFKIFDSVVWMEL